jgi:hypothetical protein
VSEIEDQIRFASTEHFRFTQTDIDAHLAFVDGLKALCARAADALEEWHKGTYPCRDLIAELRKAAE